MNFVLVVSKCGNLNYKRSFNLPEVGFCSAIGGNYEDSVRLNFCT